MPAAFHWTVTEIDFDRTSMRIELIYSFFSKQKIDGIVNQRREFGIDRKYRLKTMIEHRLLKIETEHSTNEFDNDKSGRDSKNTG